MKLTRACASLASITVAAGLLVSCSNGNDLDASCQQLDSLAAEQEEISFDSTDSEETTQHVQAVVEDWQHIRADAGDEELAGAMETVEPLFDVLLDMASGELSQADGFQQLRAAADEPDISEAADVLVDKCEFTL
ncbi:MAG: hypothetical protein ACTHZ5_03845 [Micrococcaceae bacterium]